MEGGYVQQIHPDQYILALQAKITYIFDNLSQFSKLD
jgi:hypothetical protein